MKTQIENFLCSLGSWEKLFIEKNIFEHCFGTLSEIIDLQKNNNIEGLVLLLKRLLSGQDFELQHPETKKLTKAVLSRQYGAVNYIIFVDKNYSSPWLLAQCMNFVDMYITEKAIYKFSDKPVFNTLKRVSEVEVNDVNYENVFEGILLSHIRPYHHFYDQLKFFYALGGTDFFNQAKKTIYKKKSFYLPSGATLSENHKGVYFFTNLIANNLLNSKNSEIVKKLNLDMEKRVYNSCMQDFDCLSDHQGLTLWYGIMGEKRSWTEQVDGLNNIVELLLEVFPIITVYIDGITATEGADVLFGNDCDIVNSIYDQLNAKCNVYSLVGKDYREKIKMGSTIDVFIANSGTGCLVPFRFCKKPGVLHSNSKVRPFEYELNDVKVVKDEYLIDLCLDGENVTDTTSYYVPWQHIYNLTIEILNKIKKMNINFLDVPFDKDKILSTWKIDRENENNFQLLDSKIKGNYQAADILREVALAFERSGDIHTSLKVMEKALMLRPNGPYIKTKVAEYKSKL